MKTRLLVLLACLAVAGAIAASADAGRPKCQPQTGIRPTVVMFGRVSYRRIENLQRVLGFTAQRRFQDDTGERGFAASLSSQKRQELSQLSDVSYVSTSRDWLILEYKQDAQPLGPSILQSFQTTVIQSTQHPKALALRPDASQLDRLFRTGLFINYLPDGASWTVRKQSGTANVRLNHTDLPSLDAEADVVSVTPTAAAGVPEDLPELPRPIKACRP